MATATSHPLSRFVRHVAASYAADLPDPQLLARFATSRDEAAFAALVRRHGPMVLATCRRVLRDWHTAEDCFQATFLLLARKASTLERPESLGPWLHGVATRTALRARSQAARRREVEAQVPPLGEEGPENLAWRDLRPVLDEAVGGLPEPFRTPFVLHHLQGLTVTEVARRLGWPRGTVATRLSRARQRLRRRLSRRGLTLSAAVLGIALSERVALACVPAPLVRMVVQATVTAGAERTPPLALEQGGGKTMLMAKGKLVAALLLAVAAGGGAVLSQSREQATSPGERSGRVRATAARTTPEGGRLQFLEGCTQFLLEDYQTAAASFTRLVENHPASPFASRAAELAGLARRLGTSSASGRAAAADTGRRLIKAALAGAPDRATRQEKRSDATIILPPPTPGSPKALCETPPGEAEVLRALPPVSPGVPYVYEEFRDNIQVVTERIVDRIDPPRFFPLVGLARLHQCRYKCTVYFTEKVQSSFPFPFETVKPRVKVVYIDKDHLHREPPRP